MVGYHAMFFYHGTPNALSQTLFAWNTFVKVVLGIFHIRSLKGYPQGSADLAKVLYVCFHKPKSSMLLKSVQ